MLKFLATTMFAGLTVYEGTKAQQLWKERGRIFNAAQDRAIALGRPLLVVGDPDAGLATRLKRAYGCGTLCVDLSGCPGCPVSEHLDVTKGIPNIPDNSAVVFVSCVLEYTDDPEAAVRDLERIAGGRENLFIVTVDPNTVTSYFYPNAKFQFRNNRWQRIDPGERIAVGASVGVTLASLLYATLSKEG